MDIEDREWHESHGYRVTNATEWLGLTPEEELIVKTRVALTLLLKSRREAAGLTQAELGARIGTSQSRVAFMEANRKNVSSDLLLRAIAATGATAEDVGAAILRAA
jgi:DNA-binding XRE family transcriptional regulator